MFIIKIPAVPVNCTKISMIKNYTHTHLLWFRIRLFSLYFSTVHSKHRETIRQRENYRNDAYNLKKQQQPTDHPKIYFHYLCTTQVLLELSCFTYCSFSHFRIKNHHHQLRLLLFSSSIVFVNIPKIITTTFLATLLLEKLLYHQLKSRLL